MGAGIKLSQKVLVRKGPEAPTTACPPRGSNPSFRVLAGIEARQDEKSHQWNGADSLAYSAIQQLH